MTWSSFKNQYFRYKQDTDEIKLVFFSPWCTACKALMKDPNPVNTVFVNTFDDEAQGAETMWKYSMQASCVTEMDMSEHFQITELPSVRIVTKLSK
ncbi:MAG: hypothetical protein KA436_07710 [Oligoflexales bacterium]|nr:hypothetical protein [Oligoflexales bacterium]